MSKDFDAIVLERNGHNNGKFNLYYPKTGLIKKPEYFSCRSYVNTEGEPVLMPCGPGLKNYRLAVAANKYLTHKWFDRQGAPVYLSCLDEMSSLGEGLKNQSSHPLSGFFGRKNLEVVKNAWANPVGIMGLPYDSTSDSEPVNAAIESVRMGAFMALDDYTMALRQNGVLLYDESEGITMAQCMQNTEDEINMFLSTLSDITYCSYIQNNPAPAGYEE